MKSVGRPVEVDILGELARECSNVLEAAQILRDGLRNQEDRSALRAKLKQIEHQGDGIVHTIFEALNATFITPLERQDIMTLAGSMDSILDMMYASVLRMDLYKIKGSTKPMLDLADTIYTLVKELQEALGLVKDTSKAHIVEAKAVEVNRLENMADDLMNSAVAELFETTDPIGIMKLKEIYEKLEEATDYGEDVADVLKDIVTKSR